MIGWELRELRGVQVEGESSKMRNKKIREKTEQSFLPKITQRVNTLTAENEGQISRVSAHWVLDMLYGDI